jgi:uncharacterized membrane protein YdfJ with MMPL/SSD domain
MREGIERLGKPFGNRDNDQSFYFPLNNQGESFFTTKKDKILAAAIVIVLFIIYLFFHVLIHVQIKPVETSQTNRIVVSYKGGHHQNVRPL